MLVLVDALLVGFGFAGPGCLPEVARLGSLDRFVEALGRIWEAK